MLWPRADVSAQRVLEVFDTDPIVKTGTKTAADVARLGGGKTGTVEFRNVSFTYPGSREATLEGIDFTAEKGQTVAFIGSTGSGKSSLINLVPRVETDSEDAWLRVPWYRMKYDRFSFFRTAGRKRP